MRISSHIYNFSIKHNTEFTENPRTFLQVILVLKIQKVINMLILIYLVGSLSLKSNFFTLFIFMDKIDTYLLVATFSMTVSCDLLILVRLKCFFFVKS